MAVDVRLIKRQLSKITQSGVFLGALLSKIAVPLMKVAVPLTNNILVPLGVMVAAFAIDAVIQNQINGSGVILVISKKEMNGIIKIV